MPAGWGDWDVVYGPKTARLNDPIDLVGCELLCEKIREVDLGVQNEPAVDHDWLKTVRGENKFHA